VSNQALSNLPEYQALELTYAKFAQIKKAKAMASDWLDTFENIEKKWCILYD
jgi:cell fate (sporulation/competence/biofilm development) regulator YlbF (YheA/YmcA/DUF963 family)